MACRRHKGLASSSVSEHPSSAGACPQQSRRVGFCLLLACAALINSDQNLLAPNMSACARDFGFSAQEKDEKLGGTLAAGLFLAGAPAALAVGAAADGAMRRVDLLAVVLGLGAVGCLATAFARSFWWLFAARALTGVSLGGGLPVTMSLLGDFFDPTERALMSSRLGVAMSVGQMAGQALAGSLGPELGWRAPFLVVGALMLLLTCSIAKLMAEPARDGAAYHHRHGSCGDYSPSEATAFLGGGGGGAGGAGGGACAKGGGDAASELSRMGPEDHQTLPPPANASLSSSAAMERGSCSCGSSGSSGSGGSGNSCNGGAAGGGGGSSGSGRAAGWLSLFAVPTVWLLLLQGVPGCVPWGVISAFLPDFLHVECAHAMPRICPAPRAHACQPRRVAALFGQPRMRHLILACFPARMDGWMDGWMEAQSMPNGAAPRTIAMLSTAVPPWAWAGTASRSRAPPS